MKFLFLLLFSFSFNSIAQVNTGEKISASKFNNGVFQIGDIKQSLLSEIKFQEIHGDCWVRLDGDYTGVDIAGSDYGQAMGVTTLPDGSGRFLRNTGGNAAALAQVQENALKNHDHYISYVRVNAGTGLVVDGTGSGLGVLAWGGNAGTLVQETATSYQTNRVSNSDGLGAINESGEADESRPDNISVNMFVKINNVCN